MRPQVQIYFRSAGDSGKQEGNRYFVNGSLETDKSTRNTTFVEILEKDFVGDLHVTMTLDILNLVSFCEAWDVWRLVGLIHLFKDKVVCSIVLANNDQAAALLIVADVNLARGQARGRRGDAVETLILALES
jgi:hypothetical protein